MPQAESEGFVEFFGEAADAYDRLSEIQGIVELWELLLELSENSDVDFEHIFEYLVHDDLLKIVYGPPWTVVFRDLPSGKLIVYLIRNPNF